MKLLALSLLLALSAFAQTFDVVSVKPYQRIPGFQGIQPACTGGHFTAVTPLYMSMEWAYDVSPKDDNEWRDKLPDWSQSISGAYVLEATTRPDVTEGECRKMAQHLFEDRFHFKYHRQTVTSKMYEMVPAKGGFKMPPADDGPGWSVTINGRENGVPPGLDPPPVRHGITMADLARWLSGSTPDNAPVVNKTGIQGMYKFKIAYEVRAGLNGGSPDSDVISVIEPQLGLKLQETRGPVEHVIVDSVQKPDEN